MSTEATAAAEFALFAVRESLHALGVPADDLPDDLVPVAAGGSLMPSLPGWTPALARDWAAVAVRWPDMARRVVAWTEGNAGRLVNLEAIFAIPSPIHPSPPSRFLVRLLRVDSGRLQAGSNAWIDDHLFPKATPSTEPDLDAALARLNRIPRPWHAELAAAIAAARRGEAVGGPERTVVDGGRSTRAAPAYRLQVTTRLRAIPFDFLMRVQGRVNWGPFCGAEPGELRLAGLRTDAVEDGTVPLSYLFHFRPGLPWSRFLRLDGGFAEARDGLGGPVHEMADFFELP